MRLNEPVYHDEVNGLWGITRYSDIKRLSLDPSVFSSAEGTRPKFYALPMMIDTDPPVHTRRRRLVSAGFTPRRIADLRDHIERVRDELLDAVAEYTEYMTPIIADRRTSGRMDDLVGILANAEVDGDRLSVDDLVFETLLILIGGDETTRHVLSGGMLALHEHPEQLAALRVDRSLLPGAAEEMLRWVSPIQNMARTVQVDVTVGDAPLTEGDQVLLLYPSANRDAEVFADPFTFDIERSPNPHIAFGIGGHFCLGNQLAQLELSVMFDRLLDRLPDLRLVECDAPRRPSNFVCGLQRLPVEFTPPARS